MVVSALIAAGGLVLARKKGDANASDRAAQRGLPPVPENDMGYVYSRSTDPSRARVVAQQISLSNHMSLLANLIFCHREASDNDYSSLEHGRAVERKSTEGLLATTDDGLLPPYSVGSAASSRSLAYHSTSSNGTSSINSHHRSQSLSSSSTSSDAQGVRVRTKGDDLKSGFPYHPGLFDLRVRPDDWERFSGQVTDATKFGSGDYAKMWATAGTVALTGSVLTTAWVGRYVLFHRHPGELR
jgi:hypothetical protein